MIYKNVLGNDLKTCNCKPMTGWFRDGTCKTDNKDLGMHTICAIMDDLFLNYSKAQGNDLTNPIYEFDFPGLKAGDHWCICALRWKEAYEDGLAPKINLEATEASTLKIIDIDILKQFDYKKEKS